MVLDIYTDGGCSGNPGPGGWAYVMVQKSSQDDPAGGSGGGEIIAEERGGEKDTTNNRMELLAVISALKALIANTDLPRQVTVHTDSQYVQKGITEWIQKWKLNSWQTSGKKPVKNQDLWQTLDSLKGNLAIKWVWIPGHMGNTYNEHCDRMTQKAIAEL